ncbi:transposase [Isosphaeraceae bacterium EP7]
MPASQSARTRSLRSSQYGFTPRLPRDDSSLSHTQSGARALHQPENRSKGGRPPVGNRGAFTGILFVLKTGIPWEDLPCEMSCGSGMTCWRRLRDWQADGTWGNIHKELLSRLRGADRIDWSRALIDSSSVRAAYGGGETGSSRAPSTSSSPTPRASR